MKQICLVIVLLISLIACNNDSNLSIGNSRAQITPDPNTRQSPGPSNRIQQNAAKIIHVIVALCDNQYQGIVPVPPRIGNGDDPTNNLYWGAAYGVKSFFAKAKDWKLVSDLPNPKTAVLERAIFKHKDRAVYLVADAYRGREIKRGIIDFLYFAVGGGAEALEVKMASQAFTIDVGGAADLIAYVGHDGLMDFSLDEYPHKSDDRHRDAVILACASKSYFKDPLRRTGAHPLLWTTGLMAPEAYVLKAAIDGWILNESGERIRRRAAEAYNKYQRCGMKAAMNLFSNGW